MFRPNHDKHLRECEFEINELEAQRDEIVRQLPHTD